MKRVFCLIGLWLFTIGAIAQSESPDCIKTQELNEVAEYIDYNPVTENDLIAMHISDAEYGDYVKVYGHTSLLQYSEKILGNVRLKYRRIIHHLLDLILPYNMDSWRNTRSASSGILQ